MATTLFGYGFDITGVTHDLPFRKHERRSRSSSRRPRRSLWPANPKKGGRRGAPARFLGLHTIHAHLEKALKGCALPETLTLYHCTRHTFASQWVMGGGSIEKLRLILGHSSVTTTERYAHLRTDRFRATDLQNLGVDLSRPGGAVIDLAARRGEQEGQVGRILDAGAVDEEGAGSVSSDRL